MERLGRKMVERCAGLPLAIVVLGSLLATKLTLNEWNMVHESISSNLRRAQGHREQDSRLFEVLALSYHDLPFRLKPCFQYLSHFPEDFEIPANKLVKKWVAEGIVSSSEVEGRETVEDVAESYLGELVSRSMVQVGVVGSTGRVKTCHLHDLMRDMCLFKAKQEIFFKIIDFQDGNTQGNSFSSTNQVRRLAVYTGEEELENLQFLHKQERCLNLLSIACIKTSRYRLDLLPVQFKFYHFKLLKMLDLEGFAIKRKLTSATGNLIHLRYLSLYLNYSRKLPSSIGNLECLQTLILMLEDYYTEDEDDHARIHLPNVIWKMKQLRHLYLSREPFTSYEMRQRGDKLRLGNCRDLQTLKGLDLEICDIEELAKLRRLKKLQIKVRSLKELVEVRRSSQDTFEVHCFLEH